MSERERIAKRIIQGLRKFTTDLRNKKPFKVTNVRVEHTPDGPLTTRTKSVKKWCPMCGTWGDHTSGSCPEIKPR